MSDDTRKTVTFRMNNEEKQRVNELAETLKKKLGIKLSLSDALVIAITETLAREKAQQGTA